MIWSIAIIMHTKGKGIHVEFRSKAWTFYLRQQSFARIRSFLPPPKSSQKQGCCHLSSTLFTTRMCLRCAQDTTARDGSSVLDASSTRETRDRHWLCLGACRASPGRTEEELGRERRIEGGGEGGARWGSCGVNVDQMVEAGPRERVVILMDSGVSRDLAAY